METLRIDGRALGALRPITFTRGVSRYAEGSSLVRWGDTHVLCTATVEDKVPPFLRGAGSGWITAEYAMLPRSTHNRMQREVNRGKRDARGSEIQRLIGRSLRAAVDMTKMGERTITIDCDVLQADGGTRTASISSGFVALFDALRKMKPAGACAASPLRNQSAAVRVGECGGALMLDLRYEEDSAADVDANVVMTGHGDIVEIQGTGEGAAFSRAELDKMLSLASLGADEILRMQAEALELAADEQRLFESCA